MAALRLITVACGVSVACGMPNGPAYVPPSTSLPTQSSPSEPPALSAKDDRTGLEDRAPKASRSGQDTEAPPPCQAEAQNDWCTEGLSVLDAETCFLVPEHSNTDLLIYLHGIVPPIAQSRPSAIVQHIVARAARRANIAALMPRGLQGLGPASRENWWGWPTGETAYKEHAPLLIRRINQARLALEACIGHHFEHVYLAGSSSGAYFVALLAVHGDMAVDGYGAMSGGYGARTSSLRTLPAKPFYIGYGTADSVGPGAVSLARMLQGHQWPLKLSAHPFGHGAREVYLDEAFAFWRGAVHDG